VVGRLRTAVGVRRYSAVVVTVERPQPLHYSRAKRAHQPPAAAQLRCQLRCQLLSRHHYA
jgi:hypothetical protein